MTKYSHEKNFNNLNINSMSQFLRKTGTITLNFYSGDELVTVELVAHKLE